MAEPISNFMWDQKPLVQIVPPVGSGHGHGTGDGCQAETVDGAAEQKTADGTTPAELTQ